MKRFKDIIPDGGLKFFNKFLESELGAEIWDAMQALVGTHGDAGEGYVLTGGSVTGTSPTAAITASIVCINGKILRLPATTGLTYPFYIAEATTIEVTAEFADLTTKAVGDNETAEVLSVAPGTGQYITISAAGEYAIGGLSKAILDDNNLKVKKAIKEIGDWNMDTTASINVTIDSFVGGAAYKRIRSIDVIIRNDLDTERYQIDSIVFGTGSVAGSVSRINVSTGYITLARITAGGFDSTDFDSVGGYNRGWVIVEYV